VLIKTQNVILELNAEKTETIFISDQWNVGRCHRTGSQSLDNISFGWGIPHKQK